MISKEKKQKYFKFYDVIYEIFNYGKKPIFMPDFNNNSLLGISDFENYELLLCLKHIDGKYTGKSIVEIINIANTKPFQIKVHEYKILSEDEVIIGKMYGGQWYPYFEDFNLFLEYKLFYQDNSKYFNKIKQSDIEQLIKEVIKKFDINEKNFEKRIYKSANEISSFLKTKGMKSSYPSSFELMLSQLHVENNPKIEIDISKFYKINEFVADTFVGGVWNNFVSYLWDKSGDQFDYKLEFRAKDLGKWRKIIYSNDIELYADARLHYGGEQIVERILSLKPPFENLINYNLRGFQDGVYCPKDKYEYISSLPYKNSEKESLKQISDIYDSQPTEELKRFIAKEINNVLDIRQLESRELNKNNDRFQDTAKKILNIQISQEKKSEAILLQLKSEISNYFDFKEPKFYDQLNDHQKGAYKECKKYIMNSDLLNNENDTTRSHFIFRELSSFINSLYKDFFKKYIPAEERNNRGIEITNIIHSLPILEKNIKLKSEHSEQIKNHSDTWRSYINDAKHEQKKQISNREAANFIFDSHDIIEIILSYKYLTRGNKK